MARGRGTTGDERKVRRQEICYGEEGEEKAVGAQCAKDSVDAGVYRKLQRYSDYSQNRHRETNALGMHTQPACEVEGEVLRGMGGRIGGRRVEARGGEEDEPEVIESADVKCEEGVGEEHEKDIAGPDAAEGELLQAAFGEGCKGRGGLDGSSGGSIFQIVAFSAGRGVDI